MCPSVSGRSRIIRQAGEILQAVVARPRSFQRFDHQDENEDEEEDKDAATLPIQPAELLFFREIEQPEDPHADGQQIKADQTPKTGRREVREKFRHGMC